MTNNAYIIPDGNVAIAFSGGRTSAFMLHNILEANGGLPDRALVTFQNTGREMPETLDFIQECGDRWGVKIAWLEYRLRWTGAPHDVKNRIFDSAAHSYDVVSRNSASQNGEPMLDLLEYYGFIPTAISRWCTGRLKMKTNAAYLKDRGWKEWTSATGIRADEPRRAESQHTKKDRSVSWHPCFNAGHIKEDVAAFWRRQAFDLRLPNIDGTTPLGNCDGCFLKSESKRAMLARDYPARATWWAELEAKYAGCRASLGKGAADTDSFSKHTTWSEIIKMVRDSGEFAFSTDGFLCQADDGECTG